MVEKIFTDWLDDRELLEAQKKEAAELGIRLKERRRPWNDIRKELALMPNFCDSRKEGNGGKNGSRRPALHIVHRP